MQTLRQIKSTISIDQQSNQYPKYSENNTNTINTIQSNKITKPTSDINPSSTQELLLQIERLKRKITILQKNKSLLHEQLILASEQIKSQQKKVDYLQLLLKVSGQNMVKGCVNSYNAQIEELSIIVNQKQQYIQLISKQLQIRQKQIQILNQDNKYLKQQLSDHKKLHQRFKESMSCEIQHCKLNICQLQSEISRKDKQILFINESYNCLAEKQKQKYEKLIKSEREKLQLITQNLKRSLHKYQQLQNKFQKVQNQCVILREKVQQMGQTIVWYQQLLQESKIQFINTQLQQQEKFQKQKKQNRQKAKLAKILKMDAKQHKIDNDHNSCPFSIKTHRVVRTNTQLTSYD